MARIFATDPWRWHRHGQPDAKRAKEVRDSDPSRRRVPKDGKPATDGQVAKIRAILHDLSHFEPNVKDWPYLSSMLVKSDKVDLIPNGWDELDTLAAKILIDILQARYDQALDKADRAITADKMRCSERIIDENEMATAKAFAMNLPPTSFGGQMFRSPRPDLSAAEITYTPEPPPEEIPPDFSTECPF